VFYESVVCFSSLEVSKYSISSYVNVYILIYIITRLILLGGAGAKRRSPERVVES
jgi:hypothetical protein